MVSWSLFLKASFSEEYGILLKASLFGTRIYNAIVSYQASSASIQTRYVRLHRNRMAISEESQDISVTLS